MPNILGINLSDLSEETALKKIAASLDGDKTLFATTPNPEIILASLKDEGLAKALNSADLSFADGFGLKIAGIFQGDKIIRITGSDISKKILKLAEEKEAKVLIINWQNGLSTKPEIEQALQKKYPQLKFLIINTEKSIELNVKTQNIISDFSPKIIFVALGAPIQEKLIYHNLKDWPFVKLAIGVGGTFDFISGKAKRAPKSFQNLGLEWLWRLIKQPTRIKRIYRATCVFTYKALLNIILKKQKIKQYDQ